MKKIVSCLAICTSLALAQGSKAPDQFIPAFEIHPNDLELSRPAEPTQYFDKIGPQAGIMGYESGQFELWIWPWKPLRNFGLQFILGTSTQPIDAKDIVRNISVKPEITTITYTYESFTVREHIFIPRNEPGAILLLDVHTTTPLSVIPGFVPVMQPMWPAGIGGQFSYWDDDVNGYVISEGQWRAEFICGSPAGRQMAAPPAHMFADNPLQFRIDVQPGQTDGRFIPVVIAGAFPDTTTWKMNFDSVKSTYTRLWTHAEKFYNACYEYFQNLRSSTVQMDSPDREFNLAFEWGKIALDNLIIDNPRLGHGMVAGIGLSGAGARPGFAWFFGGDAFINVLTMNSVGMFRQSRDALAFTQKWQRQENFPVRKKFPSDPPKDVGKMAHELSQSDGLCDWWNDYHYGYNHADTSPWYIVAMGDYVRTSGDTTFLRKSWKSVKQAYEWCLSKDSDGDGLMDLKGAGLGALEFGKLVGIYADVYTCGVFVQAIKEMKYMAGLVGDDQTARQADAQFMKAQPRLEKLFWLGKEGYYSYGATEKGEQVHEKTPWPGVAMMFGLLDEHRTAQSIEACNSADLATDWGLRSLSDKSTLFDPTNYNYGAVWPFISSFFNTAQFNHHYALPAYQILQSTIRHAFDHALGVVPEVFSGELNEKLSEGYHHQGFSTTGYMLPLVRGLMGLSVDAVRRRVRLSPHSGGLYDFQLKNINVAGGSLNIRCSERDGEFFETSYDGPDSVVLVTDVSVPPGARIDSGTIYLKENPVPVKDSRWSDEKLSASGQDLHMMRELTVYPHTQQDEYTKFGLVYSQPLLCNPSTTEPFVGMSNRSLRFISERFTPGKDGRGGDYTLAVEGLGGHVYHILLGRPVLSADGLQKIHWILPPWILNVQGAVPEKEGTLVKSLLVSFPKSNGKDFIRKEITITPKY